MIARNPLRRLSKADGVFLFIRVRAGSPCPRVFRVTFVTHLSHVCHKNEHCAHNVQKCAHNVRKCAHNVRGCYTRDRDRYRDRYRDRDRVRARARVKERKKKEIAPCGRADRGRDARARSGEAFSLPSVRARPRHVLRRQTERCARLNRRRSDGRGCGSKSAKARRPRRRTRGRKGR